MPLLQRLDRIQDRFLEELGLSAAEALLKHNLAPLSTRRDIAMLGLIHRTVLGCGPNTFSNTSGMRLRPRRFDLFVRQRLDTTASCMNQSLVLKLELWGALC